MNAHRPIATVIIPTHNRSISLERTLTSLSQQTFPSSQFEVIVVADGCLDSTAELARRYVPPWPLQFLQTPGMGASAARNRGAAKACGEILVFVDDDIEVSKTFVEAHVRAQKNQSNTVAIGYLSTCPQEHTDFIRIALRFWWEDQFWAMRQKRHRFTFRDLLSGNFSLPANLFREVGGFDESLLCREDYELGYRLIQAEAAFCFVAAASGIHHDPTNIFSSFKRAFEEGKADVQVIRRYPELASVLPIHGIATPTSRIENVLRKSTRIHRSLGTLVAATLAEQLYVLEKLRLRRRWREVYAILRRYWYWRGAMEQTPSIQTLVPVSLSGARESTELEIDLAEGIEAAERIIDHERPHAIWLSLAGTCLGRLGFEPGAERLRGVHLRPFLARDRSLPILKLAAMEQAIGNIACQAPLPELLNRGFAHAD